MEIPLIMYYTLFLLTFSKNTISALLIELEFVIKYVGIRNSANYIITSVWFTSLLSVL